ncbi:MAG: TetR/AcrR family transcriptional regulator [Nitrospinota bacterium]|nr:TetR/AcrR family transcriptional regulator [Nitrospinota bacterium]
MGADENVTLRDAKMARTRVDLKQAMLLKLREKSFTDISVKELCAEVMISEGTFFNYFPKKNDLLIYFIQLWSLEAAWVAQKKAGPKAGVGAIESVFEFTAQQMVDYPRVMGEIIAIYACGCAPKGFEELSLADRAAAFPGNEGIQGLSSQGLRALFPVYLARAVELGELPKTTDIAEVTATLVCVFFGAPILGAMGVTSDVGAEYRRQLKLVWAGVRAGGADSGN